MCVCVCALRGLLTSLMICTLFMLRWSAISSPSSTQLTLVMMDLLERTGPATARQHATAAGPSLLYSARNFCMMKVSDAYFCEGYVSSATTSSASWLKAPSLSSGSSISCRRLLVPPMSPAT